MEHWERIPVSFWEVKFVKKFHDDSQKTVARRLKTILLVVCNFCEAYN